MDRRKLGKSDLLVSPICLGTMMFGLRTEEAAATAAGVTPSNAWRSWS